MSPSRKRPEKLDTVLAGLLKGTPIGDRVEQARVVPEWPQLVGEQIAAVTLPRSISANGTLWVWVTTNAWMTELSLLEPELLKALNSDSGRPAVKRIRWQLRRQD